MEDDDISCAFIYVSFLNSLTTCIEDLEIYFSSLFYTKPEPEPKPEPEYDYDYDYVKI